VSLSSWGRLSSWDHEIRPLSDRRHLAQQLRSRSTGITYGMGRSYGDVCLNPGGIAWQSTGLNRFISFDNDTGCLVCDAGVLLNDIQSLFIPRGWMLPVTPGTQFVTVGGAIANDIHGKNHHIAGTFGNHVSRIRLMRTDGVTIECGPTLQPDWFAATVGGIGLTGVIIEAEIQLMKTPGPWLETETIPYTNLTDFFSLSNESEADWNYTVSWIDCISSAEGRGLFMRANMIDHALAPEAPKNKRRVPFTPPTSLVNKLSLRPFNFAYYHLNRRHSGRRIVHYRPFFYPLDNILEWNKMYGPNGFFQYQCVIPRQYESDAMRSMLREIARSGEGSFLAVLKTFGKIESLGMLSFALAGTTLALDFPNNGQRTLALFQRLDAVVREAQGRIYLAKDARLPKDLFELSYPRLNEFQQYRDTGISSAMSRRLMGS
jgi:FAD/FMN-containing dehydrogenase